MGILMNVFSPMPNSRRLEWQHNQTNVKLTITIYVLRKKIWLGELWINKVNFNSYGMAVQFINCTDDNFFSGHPATTQAWLHTIDCYNLCKPLERGRKMERTTRHAYPESRSSNGLPNSFPGLINLFDTAFPLASGHVSPFPFPLCFFKLSSPLISGENLHSNSNPWVPLAETQQTANPDLGLKASQPARRSSCWISTSAPLQGKQHAQSQVVLSQQSWVHLVALWRLFYPFSGLWVSGLIPLTWSMRQAMRAWFQLREGEPQREFSWVAK